MKPLHRDPWFAFPPAAALAFVGALLWAAPAPGAQYRDRNVDGKRYRATVSNSGYGTHENVEVRFQGDHAYLQFGAGGRLVLILEDEEILDPHEIPAYDPRRGITWVIDVKDLIAD